jgi:hypothetical protein
MLNNASGLNSGLLIELSNSVQNNETFLCLCRTNSGLCPFNRGILSRVIKNLPPREQRLLLTDNGLIHCPSTECTINACVGIVVLRAG